VRDRVRSFVFANSSRLSVCLSFWWIERCRMRSESCPRDGSDSTTKRSSFLPPFLHPLLSAAWLAPSFGTIALIPPHSNLFSLAGVIPGLVTSSSSTFEHPLLDPSGPTLTMTQSTCNLSLIRRLKLKEGRTMRYVRWGHTTFLHSSRLPSRVFVWRLN
jgi:hypothetical protein